MTARRGPGSCRHCAPHSAGPVLGRHSLPHWVVPGPHVKSQLPWVQLALVAPDGRGHAVHESPHDAGLVSLRQTPSHSCCPVGHWPSHASPNGMQAPKHSWVLLGQSGTHWPDSQLTLPSVGVTHGWHELPQCAGSVLLTQAASHRCVPSLQLTVHSPLMQSAVWFSPAGQLLQSFPHALASSSALQSAPQA